MKENILQAIRVTLITVLFFSGVYTLVILGIAQLFPNHGKGDLIIAQGKTYYRNIGQKFTDDKYFWSRPSAVDYNAAGSCGSNKGPSNPDYLATVQARIDSFLVHNPTIHKSEVPAELVTASGSGLDPDISVKAALVQVNRIAAVRNISAEAIKKIIQETEEGPWLGIAGPEKVNVLQLNIALEQNSLK